MMQQFPNVDPCTVLESLKLNFKASQYHRAVPFILYLIKGFAIEIQPRDAECTEEGSYGGGNI